MACEGGSGRPRPGGAVPNSGPAHELSCALYEAQVGPHSVACNLAARDAGLGGRRAPSRALRETYAVVQPSLLAPRVLAAAARGLDKAFCSAWLGPDSVLVGTKCNTLLEVNAPHGEPHGGMHALAVSPDGGYVAAGGGAAEDAVVLRREGLAPVQTFTGHADWVFGLAWLTDRHFVSCSRDCTVKLWAVAEAPGGGYNAEPGAAVASVLDSKPKPAKQRAVCSWVDAGTITTLAVDGCVALWDASLRQLRQVALEGARELCCVASSGHLTAVGSRGHVHLIDMRARAPALGLVPVTDNGVRSLQLAGPLLSAGTGNGGASFFDLRYVAAARGPGLRDVPAGLYPLAASQGHQPLELGQLEMPGAGATTNTWGWSAHDAVYTHCWDASGTRLFMAGGPLASGLTGCCMTAWL